MEKVFNGMVFTVALLQLSLIIALFIGEVMCIYKAINSDWNPIGKREIVYTGAALTGLGCVVGYMDIQDGK